ncbi:uncharacterized protein [Cicer arietinum]|uniref:GRF1-interacting factor 3-like n=1 Tax=Cicer arietinum TaxID=3827 RepID=A0A1S2YDD0_CICAR|nr:GRF1-interacting factor 3-like [Cicer arietinum]
MMNVDPSLPVLTTEQIQKCLEENKELIMAILEGQNKGKYAEIIPYQAKLQHNLTFLAKLADVGPQAGPQAQTHSPGQGMQQQPPLIMSQQPHVAMSQQQRPDLSTLNSAFNTNEQQQQQHLAMSLQQQPDFSTSKMAFQMNEQHHKLPAFFQQRQLFPEGMGSFTGTTNNSGMQTRLCNLQDTPSFNQMGSDISPGWS